MTPNATRAMSDVERARLVTAIDVYCNRYDVEHRSRAIRIAVMLVAFGFMLLLRFV